MVNKMHDMFEQKQQQQKLFQFYVMPLVCFWHNIQQQRNNLNNTPATTIQFYKKKTAQI